MLESTSQLNHDKCKTLIKLNFLFLPSLPSFIPLLPPLVESSTSIQTIIVYFDHRQKHTNSRILLERKRRENWKPFNNQQKYVFTIVVSLYLFSFLNLIDDQFDWWSNNKIQWNLFNCSLIFLLRGEEEETS